MQKFVFMKVAVYPFIPKLIYFEQTENSHVIVGSSNLSASAMMRGIEWNLYAPSTVDEHLFETAVMNL